MAIHLNQEDEACLQEVIGSLLVSQELRDALATNGAPALQHLRDEMAGSITPGAWRFIQRVAPRTCMELAIAIETARRPTFASSRTHSDAA